MTNQQRSTYPANNLAPLPPPLKSNVGPLYNREHVFERETYNSAFSHDREYFHRDRKVGYQDQRQNHYGGGGRGRYYRGHNQKNWGDDRGHLRNGWQGTAHNDHHRSRNYRSPPK
ncbi:15078_t:CDS:1, partial [Acaulospora colombiana]